MMTHQEATRRAALADLAAEIVALNDGIVSLEARLRVAEWAGEPPLAATLRDQLNRAMYTLGKLYDLRAYCQAGGH